MKRAVAIAALLAVAYSSVAQAQPDPKRAKECQKRFAVYERRGFVQDLDAARGQIVLHGGPAFFAAPISMKKDFAEAASCVIVKGDPKLLAEFSIIHWQTGKTFARFHYGKLEVE